MAEHKGTTLRRAFEILDVFYANPRPLCQRDIADALPNVGGFTIYSYLKDLEEGGFLERTDPSLGRGRPHFYRLGSRFVQIGACVARRQRAEREASV